MRVAGLSSRRLEVVRSSRLPAPYTDVLTQADENSWRRSFERVVSTVLEEVDVGPASVRVELQTTDQAPAQALTSASPGAAEVIVGRRGTGAPWVHHLGTVPRAVLAHASSPVRVVPMRVPDDGSIHLHVTDAEVAPAF